MKNDERASRKRPEGLTMKRFASVPLILAIVLAVTLSAQTKPTATFADYGKWETLASPGPRGWFSPDGRFAALMINRSNRNNDLVIATLADGAKKVIPFGGSPLFSTDSKWVAYSIGVSEAEQEKLRADQKPVQNKLGLLNLVTGEAATTDAIESFAFSPDGAYLAIRPYAPEAAGSGPGSGGGASTGGARGGARGGDAGAAAEERPGTALVVRDMASGRETTFGNVSQFAWQDAEAAHLIAFAISAPGKTGNGIQLFDPATGVLRVLDSSPSVYTGLAWRKDSPDLAALRAKTDDKRDGSTYTLLAWTDASRAPALRTYDPLGDKAFPAGMRTVSSRRPSWSEDGRTIFVGIARWEDKIEPAGRGTRGAAAAAETSTIEIWHAKDIVVMPKQKIDAPSDRRRSLLAAWHLESGRLVPLAKELSNEQVTPIRRSGYAYVAEWSAYAMNRTIGRPAADLSLVDLATGSRTPLRSTINERFVQAGPAGKYLLFIDGDQYWTINVVTRVVTNITKAVPTSFIDRESDQTSPQKPPFGFVGWTKEDGAVVLNDKYDVWLIASDGSKNERLTSGAAEQVRHRLVRLDPDEEWIDPSKPLYFSLFGEWTKKSGYARREASGTVTRLVWTDKGIASLAKARRADVFGYVAQDYDDSPDLFVGGPDLREAKAVTATNAFQPDYAWGRSELLDYKTPGGRRLQASLHYPAGYEAGRKYPMIVYNYELLSQNVHRYVAPSDREYYNISVFTTHGYFVLQPDIVFTPRKPGPSVIECVTAGVTKVIQMGLVDPKRIGVVGHSMGGYNTSILATRTNGVFAAAVAGAAMTDLVSYYGDHHWSSGIAETDHIETGQERMVVPLYEDLQAYIDSSAVFNAHNMTVPLLLEVGDSDGTVAWHQGIELYNIARRARKQVVMLAYMGEDHGLRQKKNQMDYQKRILSWFGHYLKGEPAEHWITDGQSFLDREAEVKREAAAKKGPGAM
jgi:dipeptidyl aminopeptidase/acylaminoacyl peptidase